MVVRYTTHHFCHTHTHIHKDTRVLMSPSSSWPPNLASFSHLQAHILFPPVITILTPDQVLKCIHAAAHGHQRQGTSLLGIQFQAVAHTSYFFPAS